MPLERFAGVPDEYARLAREILDKLHEVDKSVDILVERQEVCDETTKRHTRLLDGNGNAEGIVSRLSHIERSLKSAAKAEPAAVSAKLETIRWQTIGVIFSSLTATVFLLLELMSLAGR